MEVTIPCKKKCEDRYKSGEQEERWKTYIVQSRNCKKSVFRVILSWGLWEKILKPGASRELWEQMQSCKCWKSHFPSLMVATNFRHNHKDECLAECKHLKPFWTPLSTRFRNIERVQENCILWRHPPFPHQSYVQSGCVQFYFLKSIPISCVSIGNSGFSFSGRINVQFFVQCVNECARSTLRCIIRLYRRIRGAGGGGWVALRSFLLKNILNNISIW